MFGITTNTPTNELQVPLLGTESVEENVKSTYIPTTRKNNMNDDDTVDSIDYDSDSDDDDDEEVETGCTFTCTFNAGDNDNENDAGDDNDNTNEETIRHCIVNHWIILFVLPLLLVVQFSMALTAMNENNNNNNSTATGTTNHSIVQLDVNTVNYSILLFMIASYLYRRAITCAGYSSIVIHLLPEIIMDIILGLVLFQYVVIAFLVMIVSTCTMALYSAISSCHLFIKYESIEQDIDNDDNDVDDDDDDDEQPLKPKKSSSSYGTNNTAKVVHDGYIPVV